MNLSPNGYTGIKRVQGRSVPQNEGVSRLVLEYADAPAKWGAFVFPMCDGHGAQYTRSLLFTAAGVPFEIQGGTLAADNESTAQNALNSRAFLYGYDPVGLNWDRVRTGVTNTDAQAAHALGVMEVVGNNLIFNNATWDRERSASAANIGALSGLGAAIATGPGQWSIFNAPAANTLATATLAAGAAGVRHVLQTIAGEFAVDAAGVPVRTNLIVRDGATGVGPIIFQIGMSFAGMPVGTFKTFELSGLNIIGTAATAMTVEFSAAGGVNTFESVQATGYSAS